MLKTNLEANYLIVCKQRRMLLVLFLAMILICLILSLAILKHDKQTILVPAGLSKPVSLNTSHLSMGYLEEVTNLFLTNMLDLTAGNIEYRKSAILRHVAPEYQQEVIKRFALEKKKYKENMLGTIFSPESIDIDSDNLKVLVKGKLSSFFAKEGRSSEDLIIDIKYKYSSGILELAQFLIKRKDEKDSD
jgi:type IV conjugative transfer system protein TraE